MRDFTNAYHRDFDEKLRLGIFIDRAEGRTAAMILNTENGKYAFLTEGEHKFNSDDADDCIRAVNLVCEDIQRWSLESQFGDGVHNSADIAKEIL